MFSNAAVIGSSRSVSWPFRSSYPTARAGQPVHEPRARSGTVERGIPEVERETVDQPHRPIRDAKQQAARVPCDRSAIKRSNDGTPFEACKSVQIQVTLSAR
jgi:hypothetical protein